MVGFESLTHGVMVLAVYSMHYLLFKQPNNFSGLVRFFFCRPVCCWFIYSVMFIIGIKSVQKTASANRWFVGE